MEASVIENPAEEHLRGVDVCLILDQFGELITCPIQEGDGACFSELFLSRMLRGLCGACKHENHNEQDHD